MAISGTMTNTKSFPLPNFRAGTKVAPRLGFISADVAMSVARPRFAHLVLDVLAGEFVRGQDGGVERAACVDADRT